MVRRIASIAGLATALAAVTGCSDSGGEPREDGNRTAAAATLVQPGAPGEPGKPVTAAELERIAQSRHTAADTEFVQGMIHHHAQALVMTRLARTVRRGEDIALFSRRMELSQKLEIEAMELWLRERGEEVPTAAEHEREHGPEGTPMPGMATLAQLERLAASRGADFDRRFIRLMERHHAGAVVMVTRLVDDGGAQESQLDEFTRDVLADQEIELGRMEAIRAELPPPSASPGGAAGASAAWGGKPPALCILA